MKDETQCGIDRRWGVDRRTEVDTRSVEEQRLLGERRLKTDRRSGLEQSQTNALSVEHFVHHAQIACGAEQKLDFLAGAMLKLASTLAEIERRLKLIQTNTAYRRL
jgi:hypothetical protein